MKILILNAGSSSLKYQLIDMDGEKLLVLFHQLFNRILKFALASGNAPAEMCIRDRPRAARSTT